MPTSIPSFPPAKCPYHQSSLHTYFPPSPNLPPSALHHPNAPPKPVPELPTSIQSSLLNVGMRVRKAVPGGYLTHSKAVKQISAMGGRVWKDGEGRVDEGQVRGLGLGLVPFCGVHKVGGLGVQESVVEDEGLEDEGVGKEVVFDDGMFGDDGLEGEAQRGKKRAFVAEDEEGTEEGDEAFLDRGRGETGEVVMSGVLRPIAQARGRRQPVFLEMKGFDCGEDFGEAPFLRGLGEVDEMDGVW